MTQGFQGQNVVVVGLGRSGLAAARLLKRVGATVIGNDRTDTPELREELAQLGVDAVLGGHPEDVFRKADRIVVSPGVPPLDVVQRAERVGVSVISEVELASAFIESDVVAITGTNGKSTVTSLVGAMAARETTRPLFVGGNLGTPLTAVADSAAAKPGGLVVVELSSFQLERIRTFRAHMAVLLNVSPDHLDRYDSFASYAAAKGRIFENQRHDDIAVTADGDALAMSLARTSPAVRYTFGGRGSVRIDGDSIVDDVTGLRLRTQDLSLRGGHNAENACAAALIARLSGVAPKAIEDVLRTFSGLPHRMQFVRRLDQVDWLDDSKGTNVGAAVASVDGVAASKVVLIAGGVDKGGSYAPLAARIRDRGRAAVLLGAAAPLLEEAFAECGVPVLIAATLDEAVHLARAHAAPHDAVLLSPACSSYDMFSNYAERGDRFQAAVRSLPEATS